MRPELSGNSVLNTVSFRQKCFLKNDSRAKRSDFSLWVNYQYSKKEKTATTL